MKPHRIFEPEYPPANAGSMRRKICPRASGQRYQIPRNCSAHGHRNPYDSHRKPQLVPLSGQTAHGLTPLRWYCHFAVSATRQIRRFFRISIVSITEAPSRSEPLPPDRRPELHSPCSPAFDKRAASSLSSPRRRGSIWLPSPWQGHLRAETQR